MSESLQLKDLVVSRGGRDVVRNVSIEIAPGEITALLGPNGAGKSSMVLAVGGVLPLKAGTVKLGERDLARRDLQRDVPDHRAAAALHGEVPQDQRRTHATPR